MQIEENCREKYFHNLSLVTMMTMAKCMNSKIICQFIILYVSYSPVMEDGKIRSKEKINEVMALKVRKST